MATNPNGPKEIRENRRERVAYWRLRGLSVRGIAKKLEGEGRIDHRKDRPWSHSTVQADLKHLENLWVKTAVKTIEQHKANQLAEIAEARRVAWARIITTKEGDIYSAEDIGEIRRLIELEAKILGTNAPAKTEIGGVDGGPLVIKGYTNVSPDDWGD